MNKEEARKLFDKDKFEEINSREYFSLKSIGEFMVSCEDGEISFKPKEQFPIKIMGGGGIDFLINEIGFIFIKRKNSNDELISIQYSLPQLYKAVEESKRIRGIK